MAVFEPDEQIETLDPAACSRLLAATQVGRLALVAEGKPKIIVLNHLVYREGVFFRTAPDAWLVRHLTDEVPGGGPGLEVVYEVDSASAAGRSGWSVIATGRLHREDDAELVALAHRKLEAWAHGDRDVVLRLHVDELTGRRVGPA
ncbi:MAG: pyridoxamine 5'-phosphate oxidase family protein [Kineosporiaceae bacterium]|nr:pyridoxamine 5'-phosphate oxidase family protein [Kineosporiaceae bacterium]